MNQTLSRILHSAMSAPSGDNTQPIRYRVDEGSRTIALVLDPSRDPSPMNSGQRMARMAAGASLENVIQAARSMGLSVDWQPSEGEVVAVVQIAGEPDKTAPDEAIPRLRVTNRRLYDRRTIADDLLARLSRASGPIDGVTTHWIVDRGRLDALAELIGRADGVMFGNASMRRAFLASVRFDQLPDATVEEGLSFDSIEATAPERIALRTMKGLPDRILPRMGIARVFAGKARQLVRSASGLCLIVAPDGHAATDLIVGRALQQSWLALAEEGLATQPMMSLPVLENVEDNGSPGLRKELGIERLASLRRDFRALAPEIGERRPAWLLRFGYASPPSGRTGRLPIESVLRQ
ncbi:hypothetical protein P12x_004246 [Tundrisphaera lichenicola]|uniref:hypothetical protein n=1 Tax=Tundrisphaera lichenicola TaxID=2029860 RepID=UPI003EBFD325